VRESFTSHPPQDGQPVDPPSRWDYANNFSWFVNLIGWIFLAEGMQASLFMLIDAKRFSQA
jgi:hypothetical protein